MAMLSSFSRLNALVIDDQSFIRTVVSRILKQLEFSNVWEAGEGPAALDIALERKPDVIICDIEMAPMDGLTFLKELRQKEEIGRRTPVVFLTNRTERDVVLRARELGVSAFLAKPIAVTALREKLAPLLSVRR
jgi:two-component system, chemotaxis family, chemotaxis protein CheY